MQSASSSSPASAPPFHRDSVLNEGRRAIRCADPEHLPVSTEQPAAYLEDIFKAFLIKIIKWSDHASKQSYDHRVLTHVDQWISRTFPWL